ncbi:MAG: GldG family protein [Treponema sp.]
MNRLINWLKKPSSDRVLLIIALILLNLVSARAFLRFDLTSQKAFSISKASKDVVKNIDSPLSIKVFFSKNLPAPYNYVEQYLTDILAEYKTSASNYFSYQLFDMSKTENQKIASELGLGPVQIDTVESTGFSSKIAWMGLAITYGDYIATLDSLKTSSDIEYKITTTISKIISVQNTNSDKLFEIAYITGHNENELRSNPYAESYAEVGSGNFRNMLSDIYTIKEINLADADIPQNIKTIIVNSPKSKIPERELLKIDQFIMNGGNAIFFVNPLEEFVPDQNGYPVYLPGESGLEEFLENYGIKISPSYVMDEKCYTQNVSGFGKQILNWAPVVEKNSLAKNNPITQNLGGLIFFGNGPIDISQAAENSNLKTTVLAKSSARSWTMNENIILYPGYITAPSDKNSFKPENLAVLVEGKFDSAFSKSELEKPQSYKAQGTQDSKIIAVSSGIVTTDTLIDKNGTEPISMFIRNAVDYVNENPDFCNMRTKGTRLDFISIKSQKSVVLVKILNEFALALVVLIAGFFVWRMRMTRKYFIHQKYNSDDRRFIDKE